jgi:hypothetical protein
MQVEKPPGGGNVIAVDFTARVKAGRRQQAMTTAAVTAAG